MKTTPLISAGLLGLCGGAAIAAGAALDLSSGSTGFSATPAAGSFDDVYTFDLVADTIVTSSVTTVVNGAQNIDFSALRLAGPAGVFSFELVLSDPFETWALFPTLLGAGSYTLSLLGTNSPAPASYGGNLAASIVSVVPEPHIYALLLAGVGLVGFMAARHKGRED